MSKPTLTIMVGNIGSGKSTQSKEMVDLGYIVISRDSFRYMLGGGKYLYSPKTEPIVHKFTMICLRTSLKNKLNVILDGCNMTIKERKKYIQLAKCFRYKVTCIHFSGLTMEECVDRRMKNPHGQPDRNLWETVWKKFDSRYERPTLEEGFDWIENK
jgi:predicted kinase